MVLWMICGYLALAAIFYLVLAATATNLSVPAQTRPAKRHRAHRITDSNLFRRIRRH